MNKLASWIYQLVLLVVATFAFMVLFAHGPADYLANARADFSGLISGGN